MDAIYFRFDSHLEGFYYPYKFNRDCWGKFSIVDPASERNITSSSYVYPPFLSFALLFSLAAGKNMKLD
jgi:hypothetical protein